MFTVTAFSGVTNYAVHVLVGRGLGPAEYAVFTSMLSLYLIVDTPNTVLPLVYARQAARLAALGALDQVGAVFIGGLRVAALWGGAVALLLMVSSSFIASYLQLPSVVTVLAVGAMVWLGTLLSVGAGILQGLQRFPGLAAAGMAMAAARLVLVVAAIGMGLGAVGALGAGAVAAGLAALVATAWLWDIIVRRAPHHQQSVSEIVKYGGRVMAGLLCFGAVTNADLLVVKHAFPPDVAGHYAAASVLAKAILFLPGAVSPILFPKSVARHAVHEDTAVLARWAVLAFVVLAAVPLLLYFLVPDALVAVLFGPQFATAGAILGKYGVAMGAFGLVGLLLQYYLARNEVRFLLVLGAGTVVVVGALQIFHASLNQVLDVMLFGAVAIIIASEALCGGMTGHGRSRCL